MCTDKGSPQQYFVTTQLQTATCWEFYPGASWDTMPYCVISSFTARARLALFSLPSTLRAATLAFPICRSSFLLQSRPQDYTPRPHKHSAHRPSRWVPIISKGGEEAGGRRGDGRKNIPRMTKLSSRLAPGTVLRCDWLTDGNSEIASQSQASAAQRHAHSTRAIGESPSSPHPSLLRFFTVFAVRH